MVSLINHTVCIRPTHCSGQAVSSALPREQLNGDRSLRRLNSRFPLTKSVRAFTLRPIPFDSFRRCVDAGWGYFLDKWTASEWPCSDAAMQREGGRPFGNSAVGTAPPPHLPFSLVTGSARPPVPAPAPARPRPLAAVSKHVRGEVAPKLVAAITCTRIEINAVDS